MSVPDCGETLESFDGLELYCEVYPAHEQVGVIVALHDFGEHCGVYAGAFRRLASAGYKVYTLDLRGHGKSPGDRASVSNFDDFLEDLDLLWARISDREGSFRDKTFLVGQGLGALIALRFVMARKPHVRGLVLSNLLTDLPLSPLQRYLTKAPSLWFAHRTFADQAGEVWLKPSREGILKDDPLAYRGPLSFQLVREVVGACRQLQQEAVQMPCSLLVLQGQHPLSDSQTVRLFLTALDAMDKTVLEYQGNSTNLLLEGVGDQALGDILEWCDQKGATPLPAEDDEEEDEDDRLEAEEHQCI
jgi:alpha-beta hydrolase superfamily lysophospholipase